MTDNSKSPNPVATRERILDAALDVFSSKGYHDSSVDDVVRESNTSKGAVYFHFANKQQLFVALVDKFANLLERRVTEAIENQPNSVARIRAALEACLETFSKYRPLAKILLVQAVGLGTIFEQKRMEVLERFPALSKPIWNKPSPAVNFRQSMPRLRPRPGSGQSINWSSAGSIWVNRNRTA